MHACLGKTALHFERKPVAFVAILSTVILSCTFRVSLYIQQTQTVQLSSNRHYLRLWEGDGSPSIWTQFPAHGKTSRGSLDGALLSGCFWSLGRLESIQSYNPHGNNWGDRKGQRCPLPQMSPPSELLSSPTPTCAGEEESLLPLGWWRGGCSRRRI